MRTVKEVFENARIKCKKCRCCPICNGEACRGETPGPGGKGSGSSFVNNISALKNIYIKMDTIVENKHISTETVLFNQKLSLPLMAAPISGIEQNYGAIMDDESYTKELVEGCNKAGIIAWSGDAINEEQFLKPLNCIRDNNGIGVCTIKPWVKEVFFNRLAHAKQANVLAVACDVDASGLTNLRQQKAGVECYSVDRLKEIVDNISVPFIVKGVLSVKGALKAQAAGASAIVLSNHGGRVLDDCIAPYLILEEVSKAVNSNMLIIVDGGIRSGNDIFKALALGADAVLIGRTISLATIGGGSEGLATYVNQLQQELLEAMAMSGCSQISDITRDKIRVN